MCWLHRLLHYSQQKLAYLLQFYFIPERGTEGAQGPLHIVLATVEIAGQ